MDALSRPVFGADDVAGWPRATFQALVDGGLLRQIEDASFVTCDGCDEQCDEEVIYVNRGDCGPPDAYIACHRREDIGRVRVPLERLRRWAVDVSSLAGMLARELGAHGAAEEILPGRLWCLGRPAIGARRVDVFLARGLTWADAEARFLDVGRVAECSTALILVPFQVPASSPLGPDAKVVLLRRLLTVNDRALSLDMTGLQAAIGKGRARRVQAVIPFATPEGCTWSQVMIEFVSDRLVKIVAGSVVDHKDFADMGFRNSRKSKVHEEPEPDKLWEFFRAFASQEGCISWRDELDVPRDERHKVKKQVSDLRKRLRAYFPRIPADPFEPYRSLQAYKTRFILRLADSYRQTLR